ncbi:MAG: hypothetical protein AVDCRST_MAG40-763 [uncultured Gemmatimonadaceae bacterium]|uniref:BON domain-containing protein n=1 Tax=uncultured Gemmatimonadaceae bacterium TaxID=246130 RepID=A0A6J4KJ10_9BACT|nr:MAG: hypothetical protein AVDCRST_MAG40-763 [uncultured Gemmatimonadaceae bacterium]
MGTFRYRHRREPSRGLAYLAVGAVAGLATGVLLAQRFGGLTGIGSLVRDRFSERDDDDAQSRYDAEAPYEYDEGDDDYTEGDDVDEVLEERVLEAFRNDPILSERAVDIGAIGEGIIELTGSVHSADEGTHAVTVARGVPGVETVVNRLVARDDEDEFADSATRYAAGDDRLTEARWEGQGVGTGRRRQGNSGELDRHADPKPILEDRSMREGQALAAAADDLEGIAERRKSGKPEPKGDRTGGAPIAPSGVPKGDHVADPEGEDAQRILRESTGRDTSRPNNA